MLWWTPRQPDQGTLWESTVVLSERFFSEITENPVLIDLRALRALKRSPMALDVYLWLTYRMSLCASTHGGAVGRLATPIWGRLSDIRSGSQGLQEGVPPERSAKSPSSIRLLVLTLQPTASFFCPAAHTSANNRSIARSPVDSFVNSRTYPRINAPAENVAVALECEESARINAPAITHKRSRYIPIWSCIIKIL